MTEHANSNNWLHGPKDPENMDSNPEELDEEQVDLEASKGAITLPY